MHEPPLTPPPEARRAWMWRRYLRFWGPRAASDVDDELRFHVEMRVRDYVARGLSEAEARAATINRLGDLAAARGECIAIGMRRERRMTRARTLDALAQDLRFALRTLGRQKGWTAVAFLTLALGIGANTAVFSVVSSLLLHPVPYPHPDRVVVVFQQPRGGNNTGMHVAVTPSTDLVQAWRKNAHSFEDIEAFASKDVALRQAGAVPASLHASLVLPSFAAFAGQQPLVGRGFTDEDIANGGHVALLSEGVWRERFAADPHVLGKVLSLDDSLYTVIGVMPAALQVPRFTTGVTDLWLPLDFRRKEMGLAVGRLRSGASRAAAQAELDSIQRRVYPGMRGDAFTTVLTPPSRLVSFHDSLIMLTGAVALVLLIACANVAHLLLARAATRQRELAIRAALGAGRARLLRQLLTESLVLAVAGGAGGMLIGWLGLRALVAMRPASLSELGAARVDTQALLLTLVLAIFTGLVFGVIGALQASRQAPNDVLKAGALTTSQARGHHRLRSLLVASEMALSTVLLVGAALLVRSVIHLQTMDPGFDPVGLYSIEPNLTASRYPSAASRAAFFAQLTARVREIPGVQALTVATGAPPSRSFVIGALEVEGQPPAQQGATSFVSVSGIQPSFFSLMRIPLVEGTTLTDTTKAAHQVIINEGIARKYWPRGGAVGHRIRVAYNGQGDWLAIVGVAADASTGGLTAERSAPMLYAAPESVFTPALLVRARPGKNPVPTIRSLVAAIDSALPPATLVSVEEQMKSGIAAPRFTMVLLTVFTAVALLLAAVGLYGVLAYAVAQRTREIGIRIALGATRRDIARLIVATGIALATSGMIVGLLAAAWGTKVLQRMLYGVQRGDPGSFLVGALLLVVIALLACIVPTRRALAIDPAVAMRAD